MRELTNDEVDVVSGGNLLRDAYMAAGGWLGGLFGGAAGGAAGGLIGGAVFEAQKYTAYPGAAGAWGCAKFGDCPQFTQDP